MKNFFKSIFAVIILLTFVVPAQAFDGKVGYVDLSRLFDEYEKTKEFDKSLESDHNVFQEERDKRIEAIREEQGRLALMKEEEREKLEAELEKKKEELLEFDRQKRTDLTKQRDEKVREILLEIEKVVSDYAEKEKYAYILNDRVLIFGAEEFDLTDEVLKILNEKYKK